MAKCKDCKKEIYWLETRNGKQMPVNPASMTIAEIMILDNVADVVMRPVVFDHTRHISHFSDCPNAAKFRKER